jgi:hypothetical protein
MARKPGQTRRWCVPPAMLCEPGETMQGAGILAEIDGELGVLLWRTSRDVALWTSTPPRGRAGLFALESDTRRLARLTETEIPAPLSALLDTINSMLTGRGKADADVLSSCCLQVAAWARGRGLLRTAIDFAQAAALASPERGEAALHAGIFAAAAGQGARAGTWLHRAVGLARREKEGSAYGTALVELGNLCEQHGATDRAVHFYQLAFRAGRRYSKPGVRMRAAHGLLRSARVRGDDRAARRWASEAQAAYCPDAEGASALLLDLARLWTDAGEMGKARGALHRLSPWGAALSPADRLAAAALIARAFASPVPPRVGASGALPLDTATAAQDAWRLIRAEEIPPPVRCSAALDLAHAARLRRDREGVARAIRVLTALVPESDYPAWRLQVTRLCTDDAGVQPTPDGRAA